jgi:Uma2 family endonuclease
VDGPDGQSELLELPLTPEYFLDPQLGDQMVQGKLHGIVVRRLAELVERPFVGDPHTWILSDTKLLWDTPGLKEPAPDVAVVRGVKDHELENQETFRVAEEGVRPCLVIEVVSPKDSRIARMDRVDKVELYRRAAIPEYLLLELPHKRTRQLFEWKGYRLDRAGRYLPIEPDRHGRLVSETTGLSFGLTPDGKWFEVYQEETGERLLTGLELAVAFQAEAEARKAEAQARKDAEAEVARLKAELARRKV